MLLLAQAALFAASIVPVARFTERRAGRPPGARRRPRLRAVSWPLQRAGAVRRARDRVRRAAHRRRHRRHRPPRLALTVARVLPAAARGPRGHGRVRPARRRPRRAPFAVASRLLATPPLSRPLTTPARPPRSCSRSDARNPVRPCKPVRSAAVRRTAAAGGGCDGGRRRGGSTSRWAAGWSRRPRRLRARDSVVIPALAPTGTLRLLDVPRARARPASAVRFIADPAVARPAADRDAVGEGAHAAVAGRARRCSWPCSRRTCCSRCRSSPSGCSTRARSSGGPATTTPACSRPTVVMAAVDIAAGKLARWLRRPTGRAWRCRRSRPSTSGWPGAVGVPRASGMAAALAGLPDEPDGRTRPVLARDARVAAIERVLPQIPPTSAWRPRTSSART